MVWSINSRFLLSETPLDRSTDLPTSDDPCGARGEIHTFAYAGPMFGVPCRFEPVSLNR
jgi:diphthamide synthase (EF-2-diphthine--ammonia ligase)